MFNASTSLGYTIKRTQYALRHAMDKTLAELDLTTPQYSALTELASENGLSNAELARRCFVTPQTMHQLTGGLKSRGLVRRSQHPKHGRIVQVGVTEAGTQLLAAAHKLVGAVENAMTQAISTAEKQQVSRILETCRVALEDEAKVS